MTVRRPTPLALATLAVTVVAFIGVWGWTIYPDRAARWALSILFLPTFWGYIEVAQYRGNNRSVARALMNHHRYAVAWAGLLFAVSIGLQLAVAVGLLGPEWGPFRRRIAGVILGFGLAMFGNYMPKLLSPWRPGDEPFDWQRVHRFVGWVFMVTGISIVTIWMALPVGQARVLSGRVLLTAMVIAAGCKFVSVAMRTDATRVTR